MSTNNTRQNTIDRDRLKIEMCRIKRHNMYHCVSWYAMTSKTIVYRTYCSMDVWLILIVLTVNGYNMRVCVCVHQSPQVVKHNGSLLSPTVVEHSNYGL